MPADVLSTTRARSPLRGSVQRRLRQASGCRSFFLPPSILGNDNVLLSFTTWGGQARNMFWGHLSEMLLYRASEATTFVNTCRLVVTDPVDPTSESPTIHELSPGGSNGNARVLPFAQISITKRVYSVRYVRARTVRSLTGRCRVLKMRGLPRQTFSNDQPEHLALPHR